MDNLTLGFASINVLCEPDGKLSYWSNTFFISYIAESASKKDSSSCTNISLIIASYDEVEICWIMLILLLQVISFNV